MSEVEEAGATQPDHRSVGEMLREGRARLHLSAADVARHLRLSLRQVEALEANDFAALPGKTFARGFIRNYARLLHMDAGALLAAYEAALPPDEKGAVAPRPERIDIAPRPSRRWLLYVLLVLAIVMGVPLVIYALLHDDGRALQKQAEPATAVTPRAGAPSAGVPVPLPAASPVPVESPATATPAPATQTEAAEPARGATLQFRFDEDAWVEVRDRDGRRLLSKLSAKGSEETLTGQGPFSLVIGNAAHVHLTYNGKPVDLAPHVKVNVARLTLE